MSTAILRNHGKQHPNPTLQFGVSVSENNDNHVPPAAKTSLSSTSQVFLAILILGLIGTQMVMLIATKKVVTVAPLPLLLCEAQFAVSSICAGTWILIPNHCCKREPSSQLKASASMTMAWTFYLPLSLSWTMGFVLFNASATHMSPSLVNLMRCGEPLATVLVGWIFFGKRYPRRVLIPLVPVLAGVWLASPKSGETEVSFEGIALAALSNVCFCMRPFVLQTMKEKQQQISIRTAKKGAQESGGDLHTFFVVTTLATVLILPGLVWMVEGTILKTYYGSLYSKILYEEYFMRHILEACFGFFAYQYTQLRVMSLTSPLAFSILTPVIKAVMIVLCSLTFGDALGVRQLVGVLVTTSGGYWFTQTRRDVASKTKPAPLLPINTANSNQNGTASHYHAS